MNDFQSHIQKMAEQARREPEPQIDVSRRVLIQIQKTEFVDEQPLLFFAVGSFAVALIVACFTFSLVNILTDPISALFQIFPIFSV